MSENTLNWKKLEFWNKEQINTIKQLDKERDDLKNNLTILFKDSFKIHFHISSLFWNKNWKDEDKLSEELSSKHKSKLKTYLIKIKEAIKLIEKWTNIDEKFLAEVKNNKDFLIKLLISLRRDIEEILN